MLTPSPFGILFKDSTFCPKALPAQQTHSVAAHIVHRMMRPSSAPVAQTSRHDDQFRIASRILSSSSRVKLAPMLNRFFSTLLHRVTVHSSAVSGALSVVSFNTNCSPILI